MFKKHYFCWYYCLDIQLCPTLLCLHGLQPTRLLCPWDSPSKNTGVGCHLFLQGSSQPRDWTQVSCIAIGFFTIESLQLGKIPPYFSHICIFQQDFHLVIPSYTILKLWYLKTIYIWQWVNMGSSGIFFLTINI